MFGLLVAVIGVLALLGLLVAARSRAGTDPSSSVAAFNRAMTAMESGAGARRPGPRAARDEDDDEHPSEDRARHARS